MPAVCFYFQVHQPYRLRHYTFFDIGATPFYEDEDANCDVLLKVARKCYLPMNDLLLELIRRHEGRFKVSFSLSGTALDQFEEYAPEVLESFQALGRTGCVEFLDETYCHSLAFLFSREEFREQVRRHRERIEELFGQSPRVFRNTELIYHNDVAREAEAMGYDAILAEGADHVLGWRSPNWLYQPAGCTRLKLLLKNYALSDDIAFRFSNRDWPEYPLTADKFAAWAHAVNTHGELINLFMDYETFGEHQWESSCVLCPTPCCAIRTSVSKPRPKRRTLCPRAPVWTCRSSCPGLMPNATSRPGWATICSTMPSTPCTPVKPGCAS